MTPSTLLGLCFVTAVSFAMSYLGAAVGLVLGQVRVVLLTYVLGSAAVGAGTSLAISAVAAIAGALSHARERRVSASLLLTVGVPSTLAAYVATRFAAAADPRLLKTAIAGALVLSGARMLVREPSDGAVAASLDRAGGERRGHALALQIGTGVVLGAISGFVGLLLGSLRLPLLMRHARMRPTLAVGTNMAIGALTGIASAFAAVRGGKIDLPAFAVVSPLTLLGARWGAQRTGTLDRAALRRWIAWALLGTGILMIVEALVG